MRWLALLFIVSIILSCKTETKNTSTSQKIPKQIVGAPAYDTFNNIRLVAHQTTTKNIKFFLQKEDGLYFNNHGNLLQHLNARSLELIFAMNGGMYLEDYSPQGLYIENGLEIKSLNTKKSDFGNFYLEPNGVFYINKNGQAYVTATKQFKQTDSIKYATQSGPMLLIDGNMHPAFTKNSKHMHIRNGVGILPNGNLLFAMSKDSLNFYDFATYFKNQGCKNALYLDGAISKTYLPSKGVKELTGRFGVIIAEVE
jgi:uncharacterized protein YigE (DUF2233 family)